jgi:hypothetical protein
MAVESTTVLTEQEIAEKYPQIFNSLLSILKNRIRPKELEAYLNTVALNVAVPNTNAFAHCHFIALNGNKTPRVKDFARFIAEKVTDYALPRGEILRALSDAIKRGSTSPITKLNNKARRLFSNLEQSGEGGEVLLSVLAENILQLPQLFSKMTLKTNSQMHVHGSDGVHVGINKENGNLALYWGESKLYKNSTNAVAECFKSLAPYLHDSGGSGAIQERDLQLIRDGIDLNDEGLEVALKKYLDPDDPMFNKVEYRGLCLIGFNLDAYPKSPNSKEISQLEQEIQANFATRKEIISRRIVEKKIHSFEIQVFCLPFPNVEEFRTAFKKEIGNINE